MSNVAAITVSVRNRNAYSANSGVCHAEITNQITTPIAPSQYEQAVLALNRPSNATQSLITDGLSTIRWLGWRFGDLYRWQVPCFPALAWKMKPPIAILPSVQRKRSNPVIFRFLSAIVRNETALCRRFLTAATAWAVPILPEALLITAHVSIRFA